MKLFRPGEKGDVILCYVQHTLGMFLVDQVYKNIVKDNMQILSSQ